MRALAGMVLLTGALGMNSSLARAELSFQELEGVEFSFASGAGAWSTDLTIHEDGSFAGIYHDSDMGDSGEGYPHGTLYLCRFSGLFSEPEKVDENTYVFRIESIEQEQPAGKKEIIDETLYVYSDPYGLNDAEELYLYLPGTPLEILPEEYLSWVGYHDLSQTEDTTLPFYGLYNVNAQQGFSSYKPEPLSEQEGYIRSQAALADQQSAPLEEEVKNADLSQLELNMKSAELYQIWDDALNRIWRFLLENLDPESMDALTLEELDWIAEKEASAAQEGEAYEGGSMQPLIENMVLFERTRDRVYELVQRYGYLQ